MVVSDDAKNLYLASADKITTLTLKHGVPAFVVSELKDVDTPRFPAFEKWSNGNYYFYGENGEWFAWNLAEIIFVFARDIHRSGTLSYHASYHMANDFGIECENGAFYGDFIYMPCRHFKFGVLRFDQVDGTIALVRKESLRPAMFKYLYTEANVPIDEWRLAHEYEYEHQHNYDQGGGSGAPGEYEYEHQHNYDQGGGSSAPGEYEYVSKDFNRVAAV